LLQSENRTAAGSSTPPTFEDKTAFGFLQAPQPPSFFAVVPAMELLFGRLSIT
jgi:hypothetical protein